MADSNQPKAKPKAKPKAGGGGARTTLLAALLAVIAVVAAWFSNCIPGFGVGTPGSPEGEAEKADEAEKAEQPEPETKTPEPEPEQPEQPEQPAPAAKTLTVVIDVHGCSVGGAAPFDCATLCERPELFEAIDDAILEVEEASHASVTAVLDCLKSKGIDKVAIRRE